MSKQKKPHDYVKLSKVSTKYGAVHFLWAYHETQLEIITTKLLSLHPRHAHIIFSSLTYRSKTEIAISLLKDAGGHEPLIKAIKNVSNIAKRNHLTHSFVTISHDGDDQNITFTKRKTENGLKEKPLQFTLDRFAKLVDDFNDAVNEVARLSGNTDADHNAYISHVVGISTHDSSEKSPDQSQTHDPKQAENLDKSGD